MLHYPKIPASDRAPFGARCVGFDKLDGTNVHFVWDRDFGFHAFGTRRDRFEATAAGIAAFGDAHPELADVWATFEAQLARPLGETLASLGWAEATAFAEFLGPGSFAGRHRDRDDKRVVLFDVMDADGNLLPPDAFVAAFGHLPIPRVVFRGKLTGQVTEDIRQGRYGVDEGVVLKGGTTPETRWMVKVKTNAYRARLKAALGDDWEAGWE